MGRTCKHSHRQSPHSQPPQHLRLTGRGGNLIAARLRSTILSTIGEGSWSEREKEREMVSGGSQPSVISQGYNAGKSLADRLSRPSVFVS